jgi:hypothetical protein
MVDEVERQCRQRRQRVLADSGFFRRQNVEQLEQRGVDGYVPDSNLARELNGLGAAAGIGNHAVKHAGIQRMRPKLRTPVGRQQYARRKQLVEAVIASLKEHGGENTISRIAINTCMRIPPNVRVSVLRHSLVSPRMVEQECETAAERPFWFPMSPRR